MKKVILVRNVGFGDIIWTEPIVRHLLKYHEEVILLSEHACIFDHYPDSHLYLNRLDKVFPLTEPPISLQFEENPQMHHLESYRLQAQIPEMDLSPPRLHLSQTEKQRKIAEKYVVLHIDPYPNTLNFRNVYDINWEKVVLYLENRGFKVVQISKERGFPIAPWLPTKDFREVMSLLYNASLFIGLDSGPSHIAAVLQIPSVIFFGSVNPKFRHLDTQNKVFLQSPCPYAHCYHEIPFTLGQPCRLVSETGKPPCCIHTTERVLSAINTLI